jgi:hypothetical protein
MNVKIKTALIIIITLVIGIALGAMLNRALLRHRIHKAFAVHKPDRLVYFMEEMIQPQPEQREQLRAILEKHSARMEEMRHQFFTKTQAERESFLKELETVLTPEQMKRLKKGPPSFFPGRRPFRDRRGPWPDRDRPWSKHKRPPDKEHPDKPFPKEKE